MSIVAAKCPNCGKELQLDDNLQTGFCMYCGSKVNVQEAVELKKVQVEGRVLVEGLATVENLLTRGGQCMDDGNYSEALRYFNKVLDIDAKNHAAWWGKFCAEYYSTFVSRRFDATTIPPLNNAMLAMAKRAIENAPEPQQSRYVQECSNVTRSYKAILEWAGNHIGMRRAYKRTLTWAIITVFLGGPMMIAALQSLPSAFFPGQPHLLIWLLLSLGIVLLTVSIILFVKAGKIKPREGMPLYRIAYRG